MKQVRTLSQIHLNKSQIYLYERITTVFGNNNNNNKDNEPRFTQISSQIIGGSKQIIVFADTQTGVCYMTSTARESDIIMMRDQNDDPLIAKEAIRK